jgi:hypothetical protein
MPDEDRGPNHFALAEGAAEAWLHGDRAEIIRGFEELTPDIATFIMGMALFAIHVRGTDKDAYAFLRDVINPHMRRNGNAEYYVPEDADGDDRSD